MIFDLTAQMSLSADSVTQITEIMTETFPANTCNLAQPVNRASTNAYIKIMRYFSENDGSHTARNFLRDNEYFHPVKSLRFPDNPGLKHVPLTQYLPQKSLVTVFWTENFNLYQCRFVHTRRATASS